MTIGWYTLYASPHAVYYLAEFGVYRLIEGAIVAVDYCYINILCPGEQQTHPSQLHPIVSMPGLMTERAWGSRHSHPGEKGAEPMGRSSSRTRAREKNGKKNKRLVFLSISLHMHPYAHACTCMHMYMYYSLLLVHVPLCMYELYKCSLMYMYVHFVFHISVWIELGTTLMADMMKLIIHLLTYPRSTQRRKKSKWPNML